MMKYRVVIILASIAFVSCKEVQKEMAWRHSETIVLEGIHPIGIAQGKEGLWLSDGDHNRVVLVNKEGLIMHTIDSLDRPMHIDANGEDLMIPQYGNDKVLMIHRGTSSQVKITDSLDAPAGVSFVNNEIALADFYNNQIHYSSKGYSIDDDNITFGKEGKADGDFYYPTDVQITKHNIWVADAYNNRVQVFDKKGNHIRTIGEDQKMNAATGIYVSEDTLFVTDFENNRVLVFDLEGTFKQELTTAISKPTDILLVDGTLYIANYRGHNLALYTWIEVQDTTSQEEHHHDDHDHH